MSKLGAADRVHAWLTRGWPRLITLVGTVTLAIATVAGLLSEFEDRDKNRINVAWSLIMDAQGAKGGVGLNNAVETLIDAGQPMNGVDLRPVTLRGDVDHLRRDMERLRANGAVMNDARFGDAVLSNAQFRGALLSQANFRGAFLGDADFTNATLANVDFCDADLRLVDFDGANLSGADLRGAQLDNPPQSPAEPADVDAAQLDSVCYDDRTRFPRDWERATLPPSQPQVCAFHTDRRSDPRLCR